MPIAFKHWDEDLYRNSSEEVVTLIKENKKLKEETLSLKLEIDRLKKEIEIYELYFKNYKEKE